MPGQRPSRVPAPAHRPSTRKPDTYLTPVVQDSFMLPDRVVYVCSMESSCPGFSADIALGAAQVRCSLNEPRVRLRQTIAALCGLLLTPYVLADEHEHHDNQVEELSPTVITAIAPPAHP
nr:hypothetical protein GCM10020185_23350 [Pseudomonas brassicacearum subsp. brassicacearum]